MNWLKHITVIMLCISIASVGLPAQAKSECPQAAKMQMQQMDMKDCNGCDGMAKQEQQKSGCCDESGCNAKCPAMSGGIVMSLPTYKTEVPAISEQGKQLYPVDDELTSSHLNTQERPPKSLS